MSDPIIVAIIGGIATVITACIQFIFRPFGSKLNAILGEVKNSHTTNFREDIDNKFSLVHMRLDSQATDIRELRSLLMGNN